MYVYNVSMIIILLLHRREKERKKERYSRAAYYDIAYHGERNRIYHRDGRLYLRSLYGQKLYLNEYAQKVLSFAGVTHQDLEVKSRII